jgi:hypothetical protein
VREDKHLRFIAEKVVHQPPVVATYAEGRGWKCFGWSAVKNKCVYAPVRACIMR